MPEFIAQIKRVVSKNSYGDIEYQIILEPCYISTEIAKEILNLQNPEENVKIKIEKYEKTKE